MEAEDGARVRDGLARVAELSAGDRGRAYRRLDRWCQLLEDGDVKEAFLWLRYQAFDDPTESTLVRWAAYGMTARALERSGEPVLAAWAYALATDFEAEARLKEQLGIDRYTPVQSQAVAGIAPLYARSGDDGESVAALAWTYLDAFRPEDAEAEARRAMAIAPDLLSAHLALAQALLARDRVPQAVAALTAAAGRFGDSDDVWVALARVHDHYRRDAGRAIECLERAIERNPDNHDAVFELRTLLALEGRQREHLALVQRLAAGARPGTEWERFLREAAEHLGRGELEPALTNVLPDLASARANMRKLRAGAYRGHPGYAVAGVAIGVVALGVVVLLWLAGR